jgi:hypothetical protein
MSCPLVTISVMADPATLPVGIPWLHNGKVLVAVFVGLQAFLLVGTIYHINTVSTVLWRGRMVESEAVVPEAIIAQGKAAVIDYIVADILAVSADTGKVAASADVLERTGRLGAIERQAHARPSLAELCTVFQTQLGMDGGKTLADTVQMASVELGCSSIDGEPLMDKAIRCWEELGSPRPHDAVGLGLADDDAQFTSPLM